MSQKKSRYGIHYRAEHEEHRWRRVDSHRSLRSALEPPNGARALLLGTGALRPRAAKYGKALFVFVWSDDRPNGSVLRLNPHDAQEVQIVRVAASEIALRDDFVTQGKSDGYSQEEVDLLFRGYTKPFDPLGQ